MFKTLFVAAGLMALIGAPTAAQAQLQTEPLAEGRPCAYADVVGLWESQVIVAKEAGAEELSARLPRDYMRFKADGGMMYYGTDRAETDVPTIQKKLDDFDATDGATYQAEMLSPGLLLLRRDGPPFQGFTCTATTDAAGRPTFVLTHLKGMPALRRVQRRLD